MAGKRIKGLLVKVYRRLPSGVRIAMRSIKPLDSLRLRHFEGDVSLHDLYYGKDYYDSCEELKWAMDSAPAIASDVVDSFHPETVIDVGCGSGDYLDAFRKHGVKVFGAELAEAALTRCREKGLEVVPVDLTEAKELPWRADEVCSFEVAEYVRESGAWNFVRLITSSARDHVVLTAAQPGQPGLGHINCQPKEYWISLFSEQGFEFDAELSGRWQQVNRRRPVAKWFKENLMVFHSRR